MSSSTIINTTKLIISYLKKCPNTNLNKLVEVYSEMSQISKDQLNYVDAIIGLLIQGNTVNSIIRLL